MKTKSTAPQCFLILPLFLGVIICCFQANLIKAAETAADKKNSHPLTMETVESKITDLDQRIQQSRASETEQNAGRIGVSLLDMQTRTFNLIGLRANHERLLTALKKNAAIRQEEEFLTAKISNQEERSGLPQPPYGLTFYDGLLGELAGLLQQKEVTELAVKVSKRTMEESTTRLNEIEKEWRQAKEALHSKPETDQVPALRWQVEVLELKKSLAETSLTYEKINQQNLSGELRLFDLKHRLLSSQIAWVRKHITFDRNDLQHQIDILETRRNSLKKRIGVVLEKQKSAEISWLKAEKQMAENVFEEKKPVLEALSSTRDAWRKAYQASLEHAEDMLRLLGQQEQTLQYRYAVIQGGYSRAEIETWQQEVQAQNVHINRLIPLQQNYQTSLQAQISNLESQLSEKPQKPEVKYHLLNQLQAMQSTVESRGEYIAMLMDMEQMNQRFLDEAGKQNEAFPILKRIGAWSRHLGGLWEVEVWVIDEHPVTLRKITVALFILIIGFIATKYFLRVLNNRLNQMKHIQATGASAIQKVLSYLAYLLIVLFALRMVNIPVGAFAFLGGAIAIGVGFGAQNLINNFISGFIIMGERPINIGDLIQVEGVLGMVVEIGARCTRVRTGENIDILIPNSSFLEKNITNWTLKDNHIRTHVAVGVQYGSPARQVEQLLLKSLESQEKILSDPKPFVTFQDFGDNALVFHLYFWVVIRRVVERRMIESSVRFRIDELFREAGIVIAFPQTDVHLDTTKPLEMKIIKEPNQ